MVIAQCNTSVPKRFSSKRCVDKKSMGGHKEAFINHYDPQRKSTYCGKLLNPNEYDFYLYLKKNPEINRFFPKFYGLCGNGDKEYMIIENIFERLGKKFKFVDVKLGHKTAYRRDSGRIKSHKHRMLDKYLSTSHSEGFRVEGLNFKIGSKTITTKMGRHNINSTDLWKSLLARSDPTIIRKLLRQLKSIVAMLDKNLSKKNKFGLIGSSVLIAHDNKKVVVRLIDFTHSYFGSDKFVSKIAENLYLGVLKLYQSLVEFNNDN